MTDEASSPSNSVVLSSDEKLHLLKKAYKALKVELKRRDEEHAAALAAQHRERSLLMARASELQRELQELKDTVRTARHDAEATLQQLENPSQEKVQDQEKPHQQGGKEQPASAALQNSGMPAAASYQHGMEWADRMLNAKNVFQTALSTSLEQVGALAVPAAVQQQIDEREKRLEASTKVQQSLWVELKEAQAVRQQAETALKAAQAANGLLREAADRAAAQAAQSESRLHENEAAVARSQQQLGAEREMMQASLG